jgi:hypothetical protein
MRERWKIPRYDLHNGWRVSWFQFEPEMETEKPAYEGFLFWTSFQITLNWLSKRFPRDYSEFYLDLPSSKEWEDELFSMEIVHISEPGKERNLTKSSSLLSWVLTLCSKVSQMALSYNQDHRAGLVLSAQDWMHQKRVSPESSESYFIYDGLTRLRKDDVWNTYQDWTESTDYIPRQVGGIALEAWLGYIGFPIWYRKIILRIAIENYSVKESLGRDSSDPMSSLTYWTGTLSEGFMMGNPLTKTVLHLMHDANFGAVQLLLKGMGVKFPTFKEILRKEPVGPPSSMGAQSIRISPEDVAIERDQ